MRSHNWYSNDLQQRNTQAMATPDKIWGSSRSTSHTYTYGVLLSTGRSPEQPPVLACPPCPDILCHLRIVFWLYRKSHPWVHPATVSSHKTMQSEGPARCADAHPAEKIVAKALFLVNRSPILLAARMCITNKGKEHNFNNTIKVCSCYNCCKQMQKHFKEMYIESNIFQSCLWVPWA